MQRIHPSEARAFFIPFPAPILYADAGYPASGRVCQKSGEISNYSREKTRDAPLPFGSHRL